MDEALVDKQAGLEVPESMVYFVFLTMFIDVIAASISTPVMPYYAQSFGVPTAWIGYLYAAWSFTATVFAPMLSTMADKWGRKRVLVSCLVGAGIANVIQGLAVYFGRKGFWLFMFGRVFSGCWASVGATCNVYITDVATGDALRQKYLGQLSMVPLVAIMLGPGLGGGLAAAFGNNMPVLVDGVITLFSAFVVYFNLVETPAFIRSKRLGDAETCAGPNPKTAVKVPFGVFVVGGATLLATIGSQSNLSMFALFYQKEYDFSTLYVGFLFMGTASVMLLTNMLIVANLRKCMKPAQMSFLGGIINGCGTIGMGLSGLLEMLSVTIGLQYVGALGGGISSSQIGAIVAAFTNVDNRGKIFGINQTFQNFGKIIGPIIGTNTAVHGLPGVGGFMGLPFVISGGLTMVASCGMLASLRFTPKEEKPPSQRKETTFGEFWQDEEGQPEDVLALGKFVAELLKSRHYRWVTRRAEIECLLGHLLPELKTDDRESYEDSLKTLCTMRLQTAVVANYA
mmetsp:Transcript_80755/g.224780  ORF Transcript_80755/g.224780 Transcript_80755/m.224780 type:complete len:512 (-) Transcript_80755:99-1634(-)|eukprot:CAMPEP_0117554440 /NCGR_PEP_ID=MMETSP0784-20121206/50756_1 /TAXON_ID=39447 /ORGANISM="" /LENGTH=511 /DNA_ID=CAMNT_0005351607 /DNA_START=26 /DNA_END=1561 /DNA_ORIENTATION=+